MEPLSSSQAQLVEKIRDIVGLHMNPPVAAAVFAVDEKPQIQALDRSAPILPMLATTPQRATHDYERNGACDLFAALEIATGTVITEIRSSHKALADDIRAWAAAWNEDPKPFVSHKSADEILQRPAAYCSAINENHDATTRHENYVGF